MNVYIYQSELYCAPCGEELSDLLAKRLPAGATRPSDEREYDSDTFPKGPYPDGGGEADAPQHCAMCTVFLENPLTPDGLEYARDIIVTRLTHKRNLTPSLQQWAEFYGIEGGAA